jgi:hypothetical protein
MFRRSPLRLDNIYMSSASRTGRKCNQIYKRNKTEGFFLTLQARGNYKSIEITHITHVKMHKQSGELVAICTLLVACYICSEQENSLH